MNDQAITTFVEGEDIRIDFFAKDDDGLALGDLGNVTVKMNIAEQKNADAVLAVTSAGAQITLADTDTARYSIVLDAQDDLAGVVTPGKRYVYSIWTINTNTGTPYHQASGRLIWRADSVLPAES